MTSAARGKVDPSAPCAFVFPDGSACRSWAIAPSPYCASHRSMRDFGHLGEWANRYPPHTKYGRRARLLDRERPEGV